MNAATAIGLLICFSLLALIPGFIARSKERSFLAYWLLGLCFFWPGLIAVLAVENKKKARIRNEAEVAGYAKLWKDGKISEDEYKQKRKELLGW